MDAQQQTEQPGGFEEAADEQITIVGAVSGQSRDRKRDVVERTVDVAHVRRSFEGFLANLRDIIDVQVPSVGAFRLDEVQFTAEISANGDFKLIGTGVGVEARSGVSFTLRRTAS